MSKVTKEMINAAHDVTMQSKLMLGRELLTKIYLAMDAQRQWVGLTDEMKKQCPYTAYPSQQAAFMEGWLKAEAAHGIKGEA